MDYSTALKKINARKPGTDNYMAIKFGYDNKIVLPYKDGLMLLQSLEKAERLNENYGEKPGITHLDKESFTATQMPQTEYSKYKISMLLNCTLAEVEQYALEAEEIP